MTHLANMNATAAAVALSAGKMEAAAAPLPPARPAPTAPAALPAAADAAAAAADAAAAAADTAAAAVYPAAVPSFQTFPSSSPSSSSQGAISASLPATQEHRLPVQPYIFGCTYTTGSSAPPIFLPGGPRPSPSPSSSLFSSEAPSISAAAASSRPSAAAAAASPPVSSQVESQPASAAPHSSSKPPTLPAAADASSSSPSSSSSFVSRANASSSSPFPPPLSSPLAAAASASGSAARGVAPGACAAVEAVLQESAPVPADALVAEGVDFEKEVNLENLLRSFLSSGFQATQLGRAILEVQRMQRWRLSDEALTAAEKGTEWEDMAKRRETRCCIWLSFTSNMISSGLREVFLFLCKHRLVDVLVTSAGGIEEDFVKALAPTIVGDFSLKGDLLRQKGWNRIGNLLVPNNNYCLFEDWLQPILDRMLQEQHARLKKIFSRMRMQHLQDAKLKREEMHARQRRLDMKKAGKQAAPEEKGHQQQQSQQQQQSHQQQQGPRGNDAARNGGEKEQKREEENEKKEKREMFNVKTTTEEESCESFEEEEEEEEEEEVDYYMEAVSEAVWSPSEVIRRLGKEINDERSVYYWCWRNNIPVFCPGLTDGSLGDNLFFHSYRKKGLVVDIVKDVRAVNDIALQCKKSGMIVLGGGLPKHHTCNANLMRNGADFAVYINTGVEYDGSDSGAKPDEAVSWGKITAEAKPVKVHGDATILFPLLVAATFAKDFHANNRRKGEEKEKNEKEKKEEEEKKEQEEEEKEEKKNTERKEEEQQQIY